MIKKLLITLGVLGLIVSARPIANAITCSNTFPTSLNNYTAGACIPSAWANALENTIGITGSSVNTSLNYFTTHVPTSSVPGLQAYINTFGFVTSSGITSINNGTTPGYSILAGTNVSISTTTGATTINSTGGSTTTIQSVLNALSGNAPITYNSSTGIIGWTNSIGYVTSSASGINSINNGTSSAYSIIAGTNVTISTSSNATTINSTGGGGSSTSSPGTFTVQGIQSSTITGDGSNSQIAQLNKTLIIPADFATNGCPAWGTKASTTDFGGCVQAAYSSASSSGVSYVGIKVPCIKVTQAQWMTNIHFDIYGLTPSLFSDCEAELHWGGSGTAILYNAVDSYGHIKSQNYGLVLYGSSTPIFGGQPNNATSTGIVCGGNNGCVGVVFHDMSLNGFGTLIETKNNTYLDAFNNLSLSGWNGGSGYAVKLDTASNSGETLEFNGNSVTDGGNSTATQAFYISDNTGPKVSIRGGSFDDAQIYAGIVTDLVVEDVWFENPDYAQYPGYPFIYMAPSSASTLNLTNNQFFTGGNTSGQSPTALVEEAVGQVTAIGNYLDKYGSFTTPKFIDHSISPSIPSELLCGNFNQNNAVTDWMNVFSGSTPNMGCWQEQGNGYPTAIQTDGSNIISQYSGSNVISTINHSGDLSISGSLIVGNGASAPQINLPYTNTAQYAGSGITFTGPSSLGSQGGANIGMLNTSVSGATTGAFQFNQISATGTYLNTFMKEDYNLNTFSVSPNGANTVNITNGLLAIVGASSTVRVGTSGNVAHGCYELYDSVNTSTLEYIYTVSGVLTATTTKPSFCQ